MGRTLQMAQDELCHNARLLGLRVLQVRRSYKLAVPVRRWSVHYRYRSRRKSSMHESVVQPQPGREGRMDRWKKTELAIPAKRSIQTFDRYWLQAASC